MIRRCFIAHPRGITDDELADFVVQVQTAFEGRTLPDGSEIELSITTGRTSAERWIAEHRGLPFNWSAWQDTVTGSTATFGGEPRYHYFVVGPWTVIGKATAELVQKALGRRRQVLFLNDVGKLIRVGGVAAAVGGNWKSGWRVVFS